MDALNLDAGDYRGTYKLVGGRPSLDLVNTISWPDTEREHDWLATADNVRLWFRALGLATPNGVDVAVVRDIRTLLATALRPLAHDERPTRAAIARLSEAASEAAHARVIDPASLAWRWSSPTDTRQALAPVLFDAADLVTTDNHERLRYCPSCDWLFEDQTRNGQRRWCDMADCGSRDKARRYYHRTKE